MTTDERAAPRMVKIRPSEPFQQFRVGFMHRRYRGHWIEIESDGGALIIDPWEATKLRDWLNKAFPV